MIERPDHCPECGSDDFAFTADRYRGGTQYAFHCYACEHETDENVDDDDASDDGNPWHADWY
ncbi:hypothetical protein [Methylomonas sp. CM2]|uniref:hypothetical protein n=1 Tax=Methylomonas sp. CM2 TaxID=3417647 RepID=UPI003CEC3856